MFKVVLAWEAAKDWLAHTLHVNHLTLHFVVGLTFFVVFAKLMRRPLSSPVALLPVAGLELLNEISDFTRYAVPGWPWSASKTGVEVAMTMLPPIVVILIARVRRRGT